MRNKKMKGQTVKHVLSLFSRRVEKNMVKLLPHLPEKKVRTFDMSLAVPFHEKIAWILSDLFWNTHTHPIPQ